MRILQKISKMWQNKYYKITTIAIITAIIFAIVFSNFFLYSKSNSLNGHFWYKSKTQGHLQTGDYVMVKVWFDNLYIVKGDYLLKQVACIPGDILETRATISIKDGKKRKSYYCNSKYLGTEMLMDSKGIPIPSVTFDPPVVVPDNTYFVTATHEHSYDSRYIGLISKEHITKRAILLF